MQVISTTFSVLKVLTSIDVKEEHSSNRNDMLVTLFVLMFPNFISDNSWQ